MVSNSVESIETSTAVNSGQKANVPKCSTVATIIEPQNHESNERFSRSLALSPLSVDGRASAVIVSPFACSAQGP